MAAVDPGALGGALIAWTEALCETLSGKQVAIDGKSVRGPLEAASGEGALHLVNAWVCENQMVLGQYATDVKSNEITAIPKLLELLSLRGATVTMGAMGCQKGIAKAIVDKGAHHIFGLKGNHPSLHREVLDAFDSETCAALAREAGSYAVTVDKGHGRNEVRRVWVQRDVSWLAPPPRPRGSRCTRGARSAMRKIALNLLQRAPGRDGKPRSKPLKRRRANSRFSYLLTVLSSGGVAEALSPRPRRATRASSVGT